MFVYQNGKMYVQDGGKLIGVEIYPDKVIKVSGTETTLDANARFYTPFEVRCQYNLDNGGEYIFPQEKKVEVVVEKGVEEHGTTGHSEIPVRKSHRK